MQWAPPHRVSLATPPSPSGLLFHIMTGNSSVVQAESPQGPWTSGDDSVCESEWLRAAGIGGGHGLPCKCALCEELGQGVLGVDRGPWAVGSWWD